MTLRLRAIALAIALTCFTLAGCGHDAGDGHAHDSGGGHGDHGDGADDHDAPTGPHGGRLLEAGDLQLEVAIVEGGAPARLAAWATRDGKPVPATDLRVDVTLARLGGAVETHTLVARPDGSLGGDRVIGEPHSFDITVEARAGDASHRWTWEQYEGRTTIASDVAKEAGIAVAPVAAGIIADTHEVQGLLLPVDGRVAQVTARFPGPVRALRAQVGDRVRAGQALATVESNLSLSTYTVASPISGTVMARSGMVGAVAAEGAPLFEIADLSTLWVDLHVFGRDAQHITAGSPVVLTRMSDGATAETVLERVLPGTATASQSTVARATLANTDGLWRPGTAVRARITVAQQAATAVVPIAALQTLGRFEVVFVRIGDVYEARPVTLGQRDATSVEVLSGVVPGDAVVVEQSYLVKADIEKSGASHDH